jgi:hypothetical protein
MRLISNTKLFEQLNTLFRKPFLALIELITSIQIPNDAEMAYL